ncbi:MAG: hypothetical protein CMLOHMNK_01438 [Steroidobacteraceae bacterium]|nr:hypothetical protein [Steroidobacteraceae bacterium]
MAAAPLISHVIYRLDYGGLENGLVNLINGMPRASYRHAIVCLAGFSAFRDRIERDDVEVVSIDKRPGKDLGAYGRVWRQLRRLRPAIGRYVAVSKDIAQWLEVRVGAAPARIRQIYNDVDAERLIPADWPWPTGEADRPVAIGTIGRFDRIKNQGALLETFAGLAGAPDAISGRLRLAIVGGGPEEGALRERAQALGIAPLVWFGGARSDAPALLRGFDIFVLPSVNEGISNTILEAMASARQSCTTWTTTSRVSRTAPPRASAASRAFRWVRWCGATPPFTMTS